MRRACARLAPAAAAAAAGLLAAQRLSSPPSLAEAAAERPTSQSIAAKHAAGLATSDGTAYTLEYLDSSRRFSVWHGDGRRSSFTELLSAALAADVVMLGEDHHDVSRDATTIPTPTNPMARRVTHPFSCALSVSSCAQPDILGDDP